MCVYSVVFFYVNIPTDYFVLFTSVSTWNQSLFAFNISCDSSLYLSTYAHTYQIILCIRLDIYFSPERNETHQPRVQCNFTMLQYIPILYVLITCSWINYSRIFHFIHFLRSLDVIRETVIIIGIYNKWTGSFDLHDSYWFCCVALLLQ